MPPKYWLTAPVTHVRSLTWVCSALLVGCGCSSDRPTSLSPATKTDSNVDHMHAGLEHEELLADNGALATHKVRRPVYEAERTQPTIFHEAVAAILEMDENIKTAFSADKFDVADDQLHKLGRVLQTINLLADDSGLTFEQREAVNGAVARLFEAYGAVDATMHGRDGMSYKEASINIQENLKVLNKISTCTKVRQQSGEQVSTHD